MASPSTHSPQHRHVLHGFDESVTNVLGADARLLYGLAIPILVIIDLIVLLALNPAKWLVGAILLLEIAALALVVGALYEMMSGAEDEDEPDADTP
jgi:hypothetical protein